jgi:sporulation-control protein spo0M
MCHEDCVKHCVSHNDSAYVHVSVCMRKKEKHVKGEMKVKVCARNGRETNDHDEEQESMLSNFVVIVAIKLQQQKQEHSISLTCDDDGNSSGY